MFFDNTSSCSSSPVSVQKQSGFGHFTNFNNYWDKSSQRCNNFQPLCKSTQVSCNNMRTSCQQTDCSGDDGSSGNDGSSSGISGHSSSTSSSASGTGKAQEGNGAQRCNGKPCRITGCGYDEEAELFASSDLWTEEYFYCGSKSYSSTGLLQQQCLLREFFNWAFIQSFMFLFQNYQYSRLFQKQ